MGLTRACLGRRGRFGESFVPAGSCDRAERSGSLRAVKVAAVALAERGGGLKEEPLAADAERELALPRTGGVGDSAGVRSCGEVVRSMTVSSGRPGSGIGVARVESAAGEE